jgi:hypothetical protein
VQAWVKRIAARNRSWSGYLGMEEEVEEAENVEGLRKFRV